MWICLSLEPYDAKRLEQLCHFTSRLVPVITWFLPQTLENQHLQKLNEGVSLRLGKGKPNM
jgi:hypothetical protein